MKILVIGGTRFIGLAVVQRLLALGHHVAVFNRGKSPAALPVGVERIEGDVNQLADARPAFAAFAPELVLHNIVIHDGHARDLLDVFKGIARRVVMTSSMDVYKLYGRLIGIEPGELLPVPADEEAPLRESRYPYRANLPDESHPLWRYDKIPAEQVVMSDRDLPATVLRLPMVYGPNDAQRRLYGFVKPMQDGRPAIVLDAAYAHWRSTYGYIDNVADAMTLACLDERAAGRIYNVADGSYPTLELVEAVRTVVGWTGEVVVAPGERLPEALRAGFGMPQDLVCSAERIRAELGFTPVVSFAEAVRRTVEWELANPPADPAQFPTNYDAVDEALAALGKH